MAGLLEIEGIHTAYDKADVLEGAHVVPNANGTAPAQWLDTVFGGHRKILMLLPGPPLELKPIFDLECMPRLREALPQRFIAMRTLKAAMEPATKAIPPRASANVRLLLILDLRRGKPRS